MVAECFLKPWLQQVPLMAVKLTSYKIIHNIVQMVQCRVGI
jgi:hypothetical protein